MNCLSLFLTAHKCGTGSNSWEGGRIIDWSILEECFYDRKCITVDRKSVLSLIQ